MAFDNFGQRGKIELLTGKNYQVWAMKIAAILRSKKLFTDVLERPEPPVCTDTTLPGYSARIAWEEKNNETFGIIAVSLSDEQAGMFIEETKARKLWDELKRIHAGKTEDQKIDIALELKDLKMANYESVETYITRARNIMSRSASLGQMISEREAVFHIVRGLNPKLENIAVVLRSKRDATIDEVQQCLREEEHRTAKKHTTKWDVDQIKGEKAFKSKVNNYKYEKKTDKKCFTCSKVGHVSRDCWHNAQKQNSKTNFKYDKNKPSQVKLTNKSEQASVAESTEVEYAFRAGLTTRKLGNDDWSLDSGCTAHMTPYKEWMINIEPYDADINVAENGRSIKAVARGEVKIMTKMKNGELRNIRIYDVLLVPKLRANLLSVKQLTKRGNKIVFENENAKIYSSNNVLLAEAEENDKMYVIKTQTIEIDIECDKNLKPLEDYNESVNIGYVKQESTWGEADRELWHERMGHPNDEYLEKMKKENKVRGLKFTKNTGNKCEACILGKFAQKPFIDVIDDNIAKPLELLHIDLCGPMPVKSLGGSKYVFVIVDSYSRRVFVKLLKHKSDAYDQFIEFKNEKENELGLKIKSIRSDNGTEFVNYKFDTFYKQNGIKHQLTVVYTPQSNGVAERMNRSLIEKARTMLISAGLPMEFWAEAIVTAAYLKNCTITKNKDKTPMEKWNGRLPTVEHLKVFGCMAYSLTPKIRRSKMGPKATRGIFIGYAQNRKAYRVFIPDERIIQEVRSVRFNENIKGSELLNQDYDRSIDIDTLNYEGENAGQLNYNIKQTDGGIGKDVEKENENMVEIIVPIVNQGTPSGEPDKQSDEIPARPDQKTPGRKKGETKIIIQERHQRKLEEQEENLVDQGVRRSQRIKGAKNQSNMTIDSEQELPQNYMEAINSNYSTEWKIAMDQEIDSLRKHEVWKLVEKKEGMKILPSKWIFSTKKKSDGAIMKRKARLVIMGYGQRKGVDYDESFAPVMKMESLRILHAIAAQQNLKVKRFDVQTAYLYGNIKEEIYMKLPEGYPMGKGGEIVCKLQRSIYGLPQSGNNWNNKLNSVLEGSGLIRLNSDPCIYKFIRGDERFYLGVYVDDNIALGTSEEIIDEIMNKVKSQFVMKETDENEPFLGINIREVPEGFELSQTSYIDKILKKYDMQHCNPVKTSVVVGQDLDEHEESPIVDKGEYQEIIGTLMYLSTGTRPDITYGVNRLSQYCQTPKQIHMIAAKRILRYLKGTRDYKLRYNRKPGIVSASCDASWCVTKDGKSHSGFCTKMGDALLTWKTKKQELVALSTCESEVIAMSEVLKEVKWIRGLIDELELYHCVKNPIIIKTDSKAAMDWTKDVSVRPRTKHFGRKLYFIRDDVAEGNIKFIHQPTEEMEADMLTKGQTQERLIRGCKSLGLV